MKAGTLVYLKLDQLRVHPDNMRRIYPDAEITQMAQSIRAIGGVIHALAVVPNSHPGKYYVVDGNKRLIAARSLGADCPPLKCEVVDQTRAQQLLTMVATTIRSDPDPVSEALHYQRLLDEEHYTVERIAAATGKLVKTVETRLLLLKLDAPIQDLVAHRKLPSDERATRALLAIPDARARVKLAERMARDGVTIREIVSACTRLVANLQEQHSTGNTPMVGLAKQRAGRGLPKDKPATWENVREVARATCEACDLRAQQLAGVAEPAWETITHAAGDTCQACNVRQVRGACKECPAVEMLRRLIASAYHEPETEPAR